MKFWSHNFVNSSNNYGRLVTFNPPIYSSDVVLVYRLAGSNSQGDVWELLPETYFNGAMDFGYKFDYSNRDVDIYMIGSDLQPLNLDTGLRLLLCRLAMLKQ
jgi:hypothetical protein